MKTATKVIRVILVLFSVASLVLFFFPFANLSDINVSITGAQMSFHGTVNGSKLAVSADIWFCFILTAFTVLFNALTFKFKGTRWPGIITSLAASIYMLVITLNPARNFVDIRPLSNSWNSVSYTPFVLVTTIVLFATFLCSLVYLYCSDQVEVMESKGAKLPVLKRIANFFKDYKGEVKKIVWPGFKEVIKNTLIVLLMCLLIGLFVWLVDYGLGQLLNLIWGAKS
mgnify:CR=1 FL=1